MPEPKATEPLSRGTPLQVVRADGSINPEAIARILELLENQAVEAELLPQQVIVTTTAKDHLPANPKRIGLWFQNISDTDMHLGFGYDARTDLPFKLLKNDQTFVYDKNVSRKRVSVVHGGAGNKTLFIVELVKA